MVIGQNGSASLVEYGGKKDSNLLIKKQFSRICNLHYFAKLQDLAQNWMNWTSSFISIKNKYKKQQYT